MFERFTERARRVIFFARYEASIFGSVTIETEHLLLGILREDPEILKQLLPSAPVVDEVRRRICETLPVHEKISTSVDLPVSEECKHILKHSIEEAEKLQHQHVGIGHILLGILRESECGAAKLLRDLGMDLDHARGIVARQEQIQPAPVKSSLPEAGVVPDAETARRIASAVWSARLAAPESEFSFESAALMHGVWVVAGSHRNASHSTSLAAFIQKDDACILRIHHERSVEL